MSKLKPIKRWSKTASRAGTTTEKHILLARTAVKHYGEFRKVSIFYLVWILGSENVQDYTWLSVKITNRFQATLFHCVTPGVWHRSSVVPQLSRFLLNNYFNQKTFNQTLHVSATPVASKSFQACASTADSKETDAQGNNVSVTNPRLFTGSQQTWKLL